MKKLLLSIMCAVLIFTAVSCAAPQENASPNGSAQSAEASPPVSSTPAASSQNYMITASIESECLKNNLAGISPKRSLQIYLPPSYYEGSKAYPVVYYLHGHGEPLGMYARNNRSQLDRMFKEGANEFIFVSIDGGLSFYVNSPVSGNWEDYFLTEIIPYIDENYRTIPKAESRGICGFSMGGFGSINLALKHPDIFCAVYSMGPGLLEDSGLPEAMVSWKGDSGFLRTYAQAFAPNTDAENLGDIPTLDGSDEDNIIVAKWMSGFGDLEAKMQAYIALNKPLIGIGLAYGTKDSYKWIPKGTQRFSDLLKENGIENSLFTFNGGHTQPTNSIKELIVPFFNEHLTYED